MLTCQHLTKHFPTRNGPVTALLDINLQLAANEFVCIVGPSGCGKSTLLRLIAGLVEPSAGALQFAAEKPLGRQRTAMVFQEHGLFPWMTVLENMAFGLEMHGVGKRERSARATEFVERLGLMGFAQRYPHELSGGMRQRVGIARAWLSDADLLLMDEPFGALDAQTRLILQEELLRIWKEQRKSVLYVTHDIEEAILLGDRVLIMSKRPGQILEEVLIPLTRPRNLLEQSTDETQATITEYRWHIWNRLKAEIRQSA
ncbi:MAG: ABC transporter ATP-binding protein [Caldilineaceae bacterium]|nr:ABC transporter ATP-binding protein [Caldilineaceae bacterium]